MISKGLKVDEKNSFEIVMNRRECHMIIESQSDKIIRFRYLLITK